MRARSRTPGAVHRMYVAANPTRMPRSPDSLHCRFLRAADTGKNHAGAKATRTRIDCTNLTNEAVRSRWPAALSAPVQPSWPGRSATVRWTMCGRAGSRLCVPENAGWRAPIRAPSNIDDWAAYYLIASSFTRDRARSINFLLASPSSSKVSWSSSAASSRPSICA